MTEPLRIKSARDAFDLTLGPPTGSGGDGYFLAQLTGPAITASVSVYEYGYGSLASFFRELAEHWRGWSGDKAWESLEGHLKLCATMDRLGHVYLEATLRDIVDPARWRAQATLLLEAGQLDSIAKAATRVFDDSNSA